MAAFRKLSCPVQAEMEAMQAQADVCKGVTERITSLGARRSHRHTVVQICLRSAQQTAAWLWVPLSSDVLQCRGDQSWAEGAQSEDDRGD